MKNTPHIVGRFAPSPTGALHIGSLVTAVGSWLMARARHGEWLLRMDDLDTPRVVPGIADDIMRTLERFSLLWDRDVYWQSRHNNEYQLAFEKLQSLGIIYPCYCSRKEITQSASPPEGDDDTLIYPGTCREGSAKLGTARSWRLKLDDSRIFFEDLCAGDVSQKIGESCGDFVVKRGDGTFAYQLAVVIDDYHAGVNQVVRGADLLWSTPRQIFIQQQLGIEQPTYAHLPLVTNHDGTKLSKRDNLVSCQLQNWKEKEGVLMEWILKSLGMELPRELHGAGCFELLQWGNDFLINSQSSLKILSKQARIFPVVSS